MARLVASSGRFAVSRAFLPDRDKQAVRPASPYVGSSTTGDNVTDASPVGAVTVPAPAFSVYASVAIKAV